ncbi:MAG TPA: ABC transporter ATP-binding protein [Actinomycetospora sp.]|jgi:ABC-2 type transport system ATP-binding protein|uniref:ABC transporter ATP-binding protein n=1 Tax=Actinomycetospora sp. TaxID=1872135 RepID=UPI002F41B1A4
MAAPPAVAIRATRLGVVLGGRWVLQDLGFTVPAGRVTGLLGPSDGGKTTVMRCIVGVQELAAGDVEVLGAPAGTPRLRRQVGYTTQSAAVYGDLTVRANARYFAALYGLGAPAADRAVGEVGLTAFRDRRVDTLSGGQRARASLACALVARPRVLVLDEPTVGLDPLLRHELWAHFHALAAAGTTLLVSSHVMDEAARCDRLLVLRDGRLLLDDTPSGFRIRTGADDLDEAFLRLVCPGGPRATADPA